jgi:hypothetical protein
MSLNQKGVSRRARGGRRGKSKPLSPFLTQNIIKSLLCELRAWFVLVKYFYKALLLEITILSAAPYPTLV